MSAVPLNSGNNISRASSWYPSLPSNPLRGHHFTTHDMVAGSATLVATLAGIAAYQFSEFGIGKFFFAIAASNAYSISFVNGITPRQERGERSISLITHNIIAGITAFITLTLANNAFEDSFLSGGILFLYLGAASVYSIYKAHRLAANVRRTENQNPTQNSQSTQTSSDQQAGSTGVNPEILALRQKVQSLTIERDELRSHLARTIKMDELKSQLARVKLQMETDERGPLAGNNFYGTRSQSNPFGLLPKIQMQKEDEESDSEEEPSTLELQNRIQYIPQEIEKENKEPIRSTASNDAAATISMPQTTDLNPLLNTSVQNQENPYTGIFQMHTQTIPLTPSSNQISLDATQPQQNTTKTVIPLGIFG